jgi:hypothetical protein
VPFGFLILKVAVLVVSWGRLIVAGEVVAASGQQKKQQQGCTSSHDASAALRARGNDRAQRSKLAQHFIAVIFGDPANVAALTGLKLKFQLLGYLDKKISNHILVLLCRGLALIESERAEARSVIINIFSQIRQSGSLQYHAAGRP